MNLNTWKFGVLLNVAVLCGVLIGLRQSFQTLAPEVISRITVFSIAFINFIFFAVRPRTISHSKGDGTRSSALRESWLVLSERPTLSALVFIQLWAVARCFASIILI